MRSAAQALLIKMNVIRSPPPPLLQRVHHISSSSCRCRWFPSGHLSSQQSKPINFSASRYSHFHFYPEKEEEEEALGLKEEENHNNILDGQNPFKTAPTNTQDEKEVEGPNRYTRSKETGRILDESQFQRDDASTLDFVSQFNTSSSGKKSRKEEEEGSLDMEKPRAEDDKGLPVVCSRGMGIGKRQIMKRSTMIAKQVISIQSALTMGFVSQLWVDTNAWVVLLVEVKPNLLSGDLERFFLDDIAKVGDVVLVEDDRVMENDFKLAGLETLVGYSVITPGRRSIGKVRGYTFNINSGAVESLELDSFGISIIPSSLVSTYALFVEDVLEILPDTIVVHEASASRIQRLTKGFWGGRQKIGESVDEELEECWDEGSSSSRKRKWGGGGGEGVEAGDDEEEWELPMEYL